MGCTLPKALKNRPSFAIAYSIRGWNMIQLDREPITTITAITATTVPAYPPMIGILEASRAMGASEAASSSTDNRPEAVRVRPTYRASTINAVRISPLGRFFLGSLISPDI